MTGKESKSYFSIFKAHASLISLMVYTEMSEKHPEFRLIEKWYCILLKFARHDGGRMRIMID